MFVCSEAAFVAVVHPSSLTSDRLLTKSLSSFSFYKHFLKRVISFWRPHPHWCLLILQVLWRKLFLIPIGLVYYTWGTMLYTLAIVYIFSDNLCKVHQLLICKTCWWVLAFYIYDIFVWQGLVRYPSYMYYITVLPCHVLHPFYVCTVWFLFKQLTKWFTSFYFKTSLTNDRSWPGHVIPSIPPLIWLFCSSFCSFAAHLALLLLILLFCSSSCSFPCSFGSLPCSFGSFAAHLALFLAHLALLLLILLLCCFSHL
mgnify:CR=1 FL=1